MTRKLWMPIILLSSALVTVDCQRDCSNLGDSEMNGCHPICTDSYVETGKTTLVFCTACPTAWYPICCMEVITGADADKYPKFFKSAQGDNRYATASPCSTIVDQWKFAGVRCLTAQPDDLQGIMSCMEAEADTGKNQLEPSQVVGIAVGVSVGVAVLIIVVVVIIVVVRRRRRPPMHAKDLDHIATAPATTTNVYQSDPTLTPSAPTLYQDITDVSTTATKQATSDYEEPEPVVAQQRNEVQPTPGKTPPTHDPTATHGDTTLIDNTLYNMDNNSTTFITTISRDPTYSDTTLIDNSLYHM